MSIEALLKPTVLQGLGISTNPLVPPANNSTQTTLNNINNFANHSKFLLDVLKNKDNSTPTFTASTIGESIFSPVNNLPDFKTIGNSLGNSLKTGWGSIVGGILDRTADQDKDINSVDYTTKHIRNGLTDLALSSGNPIAMGVGTALKFIDKTGGFMDSSKGLGGLADVGNAIGSFIPGFGWLGRTTNELEDSQTVAKSSSYANLRKTEDFEKAQNNSNGTFLFGTGKANAIINEQNRRMNLAESILDHNKDVAEAANNSIQLVSNRLAGKRNGLSAMMVGPNAVRAKCGAKLYNHIHKKPTAKRKGCKKGAEGMVIPDVKDSDVKNEPFTWETYQKIKDSKPFVQTKEDFNLQQQGVLARYNSLYQGLQNKFGKVYPDSHLQEIAKMMTAQSLQESGYELPKDNNLWGHMVNGKRTNYSSIDSGTAYHIDNMATRWPDFIKAKSLEDYVNSLYKGQYRYNAHDSKEAYLKAIKGVVNRMQFYLNNSIGSYKNGGNIIPAGALHARKNNLDKADESLKDSITNKGIPVITRNDDGSITQHAEIEHSEIIFNLDTTNKLEEYLNKYNEAKSNNKSTRAIELECGKFLCDEILKNTTDKVGLIKSIK